MSSSPSACRDVSLRIAAAISGSTSASDRCISGSVAASGMRRGLYYGGMPSVVISARGEQRVRAGHPWIYRSDVTDVDAAAGEIVQVIGPRQRTVGYALFSDRSQIPIRMLSRGEAVADAALLRTRLETAIRYRELLALDADAYRLVHGEADLLPSLVVDRYGDYLVVQALSQ